MNANDQPAPPNPEPDPNPRARGDPTPGNPRGYPPFNINLVPSYTNNQLTYYFTTGAIPAAEQARFQKLMKERKISLDLLGWNGESDQGNNEPDHGNDDGDDSDDPESPEPAPDSDLDSDCPPPLPGAKGIKISPSDIPKLAYNGTVAQYNNWLVDLKTAFDGDPAKFPTSRQKIILASVTLDEQLKTTYNSASQDSPILTRHWRRFERWIRNVVLHGGSDKLKVSEKFTSARQRVTEDPNQFFLRLFNLGIQAGRSVDIEEYRTRLVRPLQTLVNQHDRAYPAVQDIVAHAGRLWQTLDPDKVRKEIQEDKERKHRQHRDSKKDLKDSRSGHFHDRYGSRDKNSQAQKNSQSKKPRLSEEERQYRRENKLCFKCGYPGHLGSECIYKFNPKRVQLRKKNDKEKDKAKSQPAGTGKRARTDQLRVDDHDVHTTDESDDHESKPERPNKRQKN